MGITRLPAEKTYLLRRGHEEADVRMSDSLFRDFENGDERAVRSVFRRFYDAVTRQAVQDGRWWFDPPEYSSRSYRDRPIQIIKEVAEKA